MYAGIPGRYVIPISGLRLPTLRPSHRVALAVLLVLALLALSVAWFALKPYAEARIRRRIVDTLGARLHATVTLDPPRLMFQRGIRLEATNIRAVPLGAPPAAAPILTIAVVHARVTLLNLLFHSARDMHVAAHGLVLDLSADTRHLLAQAPSTGGGTVSLPLERLVVVDSTLMLEPATPGKSPVVIHCSRLVLEDLDDPGTPTLYTADLSAPIPGLHASGRFGPLNLAQPRDTRIDGAYQIESAALDPLPGLTGKVFAKGSLQGTLGQVAIQGEARSSDFALDVSAHSFAVTATYRALFDLTSGDVALPALSARFLHTAVQASGRIQRLPAGRHISLDLHIRDGRNEDVIALLSRARPPFSANISLDSALDVPPGAIPLVQRLHATGRASLSGIRWTSPALQSQMNSLSMRASDHADQAEDHPETIPLANSSMTGNFALSRADIAIDHLTYAMPGAVILMQGHYPLLQPSLDFHGLARTVATASHMETGIKSILLIPIAPFLKKKNIGMQVPVSLTGAKSSPQLALDFNHRRQQQAISRGNSTLPHR